MAPAFDLDLCDVGEFDGGGLTEVVEGGAIEEADEEGNAEDDDARERFARIGLKVLFVFVTSRYAQEGTTTCVGTVCRNCPTSTRTQLAAQEVQF